MKKMSPLRTIAQGSTDAWKTPHFDVDGRRACRTMCREMVLPGLAAMLAGSGTRARREKTSGFLARGFSFEDRSCYEQLAAIGALGATSRWAGFVLIVAGSCGVVRPREAFGVMEKQRILREPRPVFRCSGAPPVPPSTSAGLPARPGRSSGGLETA